MGRSRSKASSRGPASHRRCRCRRARPTSIRFLLRLPGLTKAGHYALANLRIVREEIVAGQPVERTVLDVAPSAVDVEVIDEILITSVTTRPLTLDEIRQRGIVLDADDYLGFEFTLAMKLESTPVNVSFPVAFNREGVAVPAYLTPPGVSRTGISMPTIVPMLLEARPTGAEAGGPSIPLTLDGGEEIRIPSLLVIPGNVGYLKQFFSAQLFVANGAPTGTRLSLHDVTGTIALPAGADHVVGTTDDPLSLAQTETGVHATLPIRGVGLDGLPATGDDRGDLGPGEQGQAEFLIRGDLEGFHTIGFDISAALDGLPIGPVTVTGKASGGVLVRNPYFDITFTAPAVVRDGEPFSLFATVTNIGQGIANDLNVSLDAAALSGLHLVEGGTQQIGTLRSGDAETLEFKFVSERTGQVVASYLDFATTNGTTGTLKFTAGIGERGVPLSPDTLVLPASVDWVPDTLVRAAMRVLGQAWSVANAPQGTLRTGVIRPTKDAVIGKALALAEAGLRIELGQPEADALGDLALDWYVGAPPTRPTATLDPGLDQIHRDTNAGHALALAFGAALLPGVQAAGGALGYEQERTAVAVSGPDFVSFVVSGATGAITLEDGAGRRSVVSRTATRGSLAVPGAAFLPLGAAADAPILGLVTRPLSGVYTIGIDSASAVSVATTAPRGDGRFAHAEKSFAVEDGRVEATVQIDLARPDRIATAQTYAGTEITGTVTTSTVTSTGPSLISAHIVGPETLDSAGPFGLNAIALFDRVVDPTRAALPSTWRIMRRNEQAAANDIVAAQAVLSGRFVALSLAQPEGPNVAMDIAASALPDARGVSGAAGRVPLASRLTDPGAIVTGRVQQADGTPISGSVIYANNTDIVTCHPTRGNEGLARATLDATGRFEFRYVRQDNCGFPFTIVTTDPQTGGRTEAARHVRGPGEHIVVDVTLFARGSVAGTVRDANGHPVGGASVVAVSATDPQIGGRATTDGDGFYVIPGITVGGVNVRAVRGESAGAHAGRIERGGTTAIVDVTMDGGTATVTGIVNKPVPGGQAPVRGAVLTYYVDGTLISYTTSDEQGRFTFTRMPSGDFQVQAKYDLASFGVSGAVGAGETRTLTILLPVPQTGTVTGVVRKPDGSTVSGALVSVAGRGQLTTATGMFEIAGVAAGSQVVLAATRDESQQGTASVTVPVGGSVAAAITLSGLGRVRVSVVGPDGLAVRNATVTLAGRCSDPCGCMALSTGPTGAPVIFEGQRLGRVDAKAISVVGGVYDAGAASGSLLRDGETVDVTIVLRGFGTITGTVYGANGLIAFGADVVIDARHFVNDGGFQCGMVGGAAHRVRTDNAGRFRVPNVGVGPVTVIATHPFAPTPAAARATLSAAGQTVDVRLDLTSTIAGVLSGRVVLPDGVTAAGAGVSVTIAGQLPDVTVSTDATGAFHFARVFPEGRYSLTARDPLTGGQVQEQVYLRTGQDLVQDLKLKGRGRLSVTVEDAGGTQVHRAFVRVAEGAFPAQRYERRLDESTESRAVFDSVYEGPISIEVFELEGSRGGRLSTVMVRDTLVNAVVRLEAVGTVRGTLRMPLTGAPVPFATVRLLAGNRVIGQATTGEVGDARGTFRFDYVPSGPFKLEALDPATARTGAANGSIVAQGDDRVVDITLQALGTVTGLVTSNGAPQPAAIVEIQSGFYRVTTLADSNGRYRVEGVPEGKVTVTASLDGRFLAGTVEDYIRTDGETITLDVALRGSSPLTGVVHRFNDTPAPVAVVTVKSRGYGGGWLTTPTDGTGHFAFDRVPDGPADIEVEVPGSVDRGLLRDVQIGATPDPVTVRLNGTGALTGTARDSSGNAVGGRLRVAGTGAFPFQTTIIVPSSGAYAFSELLAGDVTLSLENSENGLSRFGTSAGTIVAAATPADPATVIDVTLQQTGTVTLRVVRPGGALAAGADVRIELSDRRGVASATTGLDGRITVAGIPLGGFAVKITDPIAGGVAYVPTASIDGNGQVVDVGDVTLDLTPLSATPDPADGATGVNPFVPVRLTFSQPLFPGYHTGIRLYSGSTLLSNFPLLSADGRTITFTGTLPVSTDVTISVPGSVFDIFLRHPAPFTSQFRTADQPPLAVLSVLPADGATDVAVDAPIRVEFSVPLASNGLRVLYGGEWAFWATITMSEDNRVATITGPWPADTEVTVEALGSFTRDIYGRTLGTTFQSRFRTPDTVGPLVIGRVPASGATEVPAGSVIVVTFGEPVSFIGTIRLVGPGGIIIGGTTSLDASGRVATFEPAAAVIDNASYSVQVYNARDLSGNVQGGVHSWSFATRDTQPPTLTLVSPIGTSFVRRPQISVEWADALSGVDLATARLRLDGVDVVPTTSVISNQMRFTPPADLPDGQHTIYATVADRRGNVSLPLEATFQVSGQSPTVRVTFLSAGGQAIAGATASIQDSTGSANYFTVYGTTDAAGQATFTQVPPGEFRVSASDSNRYSSATIVLTDADFGQVRDVVLYRQWVGSLLIRTFAAGRTPLPGVTVDVYCPQREDNCSTESDGTVHTDYFAAQAVVGREVTGRYSVMMSPFGQAQVTASGRVVLGADGEEATLDLEFPLSVVRGTARFDDGEPIGRASAFAGFTDAEGQPVTITGATSSSDPSQFTIIGVPVGPFTVSVQDAGHTDLVGMAPGVLSDPATPLTLDVTLEPSAGLEGTVLYAPGQPAAFASIFLTTSRGTYRTTATDEVGHYALTRLPLGTSSVEASLAPFYGFATGSLATPGETVTVDITFPPSTAIAGVVRDAAGTPVPGVSVSIWAETLGTFAYALTDELGAYRFDHVPLGTVRVDSATPGGVGVSATASLETAETTIVVDLTFPPTGRFTLRLVSPDGTPLVGEGYVTVGGVPYYVWTGETERELPLGELTIAARAHATGVVVEGTASLTTLGQVAEVTLTVPPPASLTATVYLGNSSIVAAGVEVQVLIDLPAPFPDAGMGSSTDGNGTRSFSGLPPGAATITSRRCINVVNGSCSFERGTTTVTLVSGETTNVVVRLFPE